MPLAYLFWHGPAAGVDREGYEEGMRRFHRALALPGSRTFRLRRAPYEGGPRGAYEDWYPVDDWAAIGELNTRAISGASRSPHDAVAAKAGAGAGGIYALVQAEKVAPSFAAWLAKPAGMAGEEWLTSLREAAPRAAIWRRQMVLGPAPEFGVFADEPLSLPWPVTTTDPEPL